MSWRDLFTDSQLIAMANGAQIKITAITQHLVADVEQPYCQLRLNSMYNCARRHGHQGPHLVAYGTCNTLSGYRRGEGIHHISRVTD
jgi:hypothetical protein